MDITSFDGTNIWYQYTKKSDMCIIFVHGWANNWTVWDKELRFLSDIGYSTLALDLRGHGQSDQPEEKDKYSLEFFAQDIHEIVKKEKIKNVILVGHSMGGMISLMYYKLFGADNSVKSLVLCDSTSKNAFQHTKINRLSPFVKHVLDFLIEHEEVQTDHFGHMKDVDLNKYKDSSDFFVFYEGLHNTSMKSVFTCMEAMLNCDVSSILPTIEQPVLIIEGSEDKVLPRIDSINMYNEMKGSEIDFIPHGKHFVNLESPEVIDKLIYNFLKHHDL